MTTHTKETPAAVLTATGVDIERAAKLEAARVSREIRFGTGRPLDTGRAPITDSPLFGGVAQFDLFGGSN